METKISNICNFTFEYFTQDNMALGCVGNNKEWEPHITNFVKLYNNLYNIENIIDVGANFGYHTIVFSREVKGNVFAFEPQIQNFSLLEKNVKHNDINNIILYNYACGDDTCDIKMPIIQNISHRVNMGDFTPNVILYNNDNFSVTKSVLLDNMDLPKIDLIKIDVQGWEKKVLTGCYNILKTYKPILIVEFEYFQLSKTNTTCKELFDFIRNNNYYIFYLEYEYPSDHICVHNDNLNDFRRDFNEYIHSHTLDNGLNNNIQYGVNEKIVIHNLPIKYM